MSAGVFAGICAGIFHLAGFILYGRNLLRDESHPAAASWMLWSIFASLNCVTYIVMTGDSVKGILPIASSVACVGMFIFSLIRGNLSWPDKWDAAALCVGIFACVVWWYSRSATYANLILQICSIISFIPTYRSIFKMQKNDLPLPWYLWAFSYVCAAGAVLLRWRGNYADLVFPINDLTLHVLVIIFIFYRTQFLQKD